MDGNRGSRLDGFADVVPITIGPGGPFCALQSLPLELVPHLHPIVIIFDTDLIPLE